jgi:hypothetical protein
MDEAPDLSIWEVRVQRREPTYTAQHPNQHPSVTALNGSQ